MKTDPKESAKKDLTELLLWKFKQVLRVYCGDSVGNENSSQ